MPVPTPSNPTPRPPARLALAAALSLALALVLASAPARAATVVFSTDFENGIPAEFAAPGCLIDPVSGYGGLGTGGRTFGGTFLRYTATDLMDTRLTLRNLPPHHAVSLGFLLAVIDSWDGTELLQVWVDGVVRFEHWFQLATGDTSSYIAPPGGLLSRGTDLGFSGGYYYSRDRAYDLYVEPAFRDIPHTADSLVVVWRLSAVSGAAATHWQGGTDESWAIERVEVEVATAGSDVGPGGPRTALALGGVRPNPSRDGRLRAQFTLPDRGRATLELFDLAGRRLESRAVGDLGPGTHTLDLAANLALPAGVYLLRLAHGDEVRHARAAIVR